MSKKIKLFSPTIGSLEKKEVLKVLDSGFWASGGGTRNVLKFEKKMGNYLNSKNVVSVNNGTSALHLAVSSFDVKKKEILMPSLSFVSTAHCATYNDAKPVFVEVDPKTLCIDIDDLKRKISKKTGLILPVHFGGLPCDLKQISKIAKEFELPIVEDAAHAFGASYNGKKIGTHSEAVCFSFHPVKNLAMPNGGAIVLNKKNSKIKIEKIKEQRWCGISNRKDSVYDIKNLGWNFYMNEISAVIGIQQLKKIDKLNRKRKKIAEKYSKEIQLEEKMPYNKECVYHLYWIKVKNRNKFMKKMAEKDIETGIHYLPIHKMSFYKTMQKLPITEKISEHIVSLPIHTNLSNNEIEKIIKYTNMYSEI